mgnify:CR=1 FL=1
MVTCRDIITRALQQARIVPLGRTPSAKESEAGLSALQGMYEGWVSGSMFGRLKDVYETSDYDANPGERVYADGFTVTLPTEVEDGTETPRDLAVISVYNGGWVNWIWDGAWINLTALTLNNDAPLASRDREGLAAALAAYLAEGFGSEIGPQTARRAARYESSLSLKLGSTQDATAPDYF